MTGYKTTTLFAVLLFVTFAVWGCPSREERKTQGPPLEISVGITPTVYSGLITIADEKGFFRESGLKVSIKEYTSGLAAMEAMCRREVQMATAADLAFALKIRDDPSLRVMASIGLANTNEVVARRDSNIHEPSDLKGKRIGVTPNTISEYYLYTFLLAHGISQSEVTAVNIAPPGMVDAIAGSEVDAISIWDSYVYQARERLGDNAVSWPAQNNQDYHWLLIARESLIQSPEPLKRFLKALVTAENFLLAHEDDARSIIMHRWGFAPEFMRGVWEKTKLSVSLDQSLIRSLETAANWRMGRESTPSNMPNPLNYIYTGALDEIDPRVVTIFR